MEQCAYATSQVFILRSEHRAGFSMYGLTDFSFLQVVVY